MDGLERDNSNVKDQPHERRLRGAPALRAHFTLLVGLAFCGLAFWFELGRALRGNALSWAYVFEWPLLGIFALYMWWNVLNPDRQRNRKAGAKAKKPALAPEYQGMLAAWQDHQRELALSQEASDRERPASDGTNDPT